MPRKTIWSAALLGTLLASVASGQAPASDRQVFVHGGGFLPHDRIDPVTGVTAGNLFLPWTEVAATRADVSRELRGFVDWDVFDTVAAGGGSGRFTLPAFDGVILELIVDHRESRSATSETWFGRIAGIALSDFVLVREEDVVHLTVRDYPGHRTWKLRWDGAGAYALRLLGPAAGRQGRCASSCDASAATPSGTPPGAPPTGAPSYTAVADPVNEVDVLFVATSETFSDYGGSLTAFKAAAQAYVADFNMRCANSTVDSHLRVSGVLALPGYHEHADGEVDLDRLTDQGDGWLEEVHDVREDARADLVALIRRSKWGCSGNSCTYGVAWLPDSLNTMSSGLPDGFEGGYGFSVTCEDGDELRTFSHEIGHNFGACHDADTGGCDNGAITASPRGIWRGCEDAFGTFCLNTTMSYTPSCSYGTESIPYWSRENLYYNVSVPLGSCQLAMWDSVSKVQNLIHVSRGTLAQNRSGATLKWASPGASGAQNGTLTDPFPSIQAAVASVQGGVAEGLVKATAGTYVESGAAGGTLVLSNPCRIEPETGATITIR